MCISSNSFMPNPLKLYRCIGHGLEVCILLEYNPHINFVTLHQINLIIFQSLLHSKCLDSRYIVCATPTIIVC